MNWGTVLENKIQQHVTYSLVLLHKVLDIFHYEASRLRLGDELCNGAGNIALAQGPKPEINYHKTMIVKSSLD